MAPCVLRSTWAAHLEEFKLILDCSQIESMTRRSNKNQTVSTVATIGQFPTRSTPSAMSTVVPAKRDSTLRTVRVLQFVIANQAQWAHMFNLKNCWDRCDSDRCEADRCDSRPFDSTHWIHSNDLASLSANFVDINSTDCLSCDWSDHRSLVVIVRISQTACNE